MYRLSNWFFSLEVKPTFYISKQHLTRSDTKNENSIKTYSLQIDSSIVKQEGGIVFTKTLSKFIRLSLNSILNWNNIHGIKFFYLILFNIGDLRNRKLKYSLKDSLNSFCKCNFKEPIIHVFLQSPLFETKTVDLTLIY